MSMSMSKVNVGHMGTSNGNQLYVDIAGYRILVCIHLTDIARHKTIENHEEFGTFKGTTHLVKAKWVVAFIT